AGTLLDAADHERTAWGVGLQFAIPLTPHSFSLQAGTTNSATLQGASRGADEVRYGFEFTVPVALRRYFGSRTPPVAVVSAPVADADSARRVAIVDSVRAVLEAGYARRWQADSLRFALRDDSIQLAARLDSIRQQERRDSIRLAEAEAAQRAAAERARQEAERRRAERPPVRAGMRNLAYLPARIEVVVGTTITWQNNDQVDHSVTATDRSWDSGLIRPGATWQRTFNRAGTYTFFCTPHPFMTGVVIVREP
ncbi:MAG TPA: cupredoxin family copper-binding protein, partial [Longimicrobiales bacterium]|nr:cupredoxin family copper-binding protein [Longimicrobiales bacterium]